MLLLKTFGGLSLGGEPLPAAAVQRRRLTLLVILARGPAGGVPRDRLLALLWPESSDARARHALDQLLYATRRTLGRDAVLTEHGQVRLNPERVSADCLDFTAALAAHDDAAAVALYAGPFLDSVHLADSVELEQWVEGERSVLSGQFRAALERLAADAERRRDLGAAVQWWQRRAVDDPLDARVARQLMQAQLAAGNAAGALQQGQVHADAMRSELGLAPSESVQALVEEILAASPAAASPAALPPPAVPTDPLPSVPMPHATPPAGIPLRGTSAPARRAALVAMAALVSVVVAFGSMAIADETGAVGKSEAAADETARQLYLRGRIAWNRRSQAGLQEAVVLFRRSTERDPLLAEAHAGLAEAYVMLGYHGFGPPDAMFPKGKAAALAALELDATSAAAYAALGVALQAERRWVESEDAFRSAVAAGPAYATAHQWYALLLCLLERDHEAVEYARTAAILDPLSVQVQNTYAVALQRAGSADSAAAVYRRIVTSEPDTGWVRQNPWVLSNFGKLAARRGRPDEALRLIDRAIQAAPGHPRPLFDRALTHLALADTAAARRGLDAADPEHPAYSIYRALLYTQLGETDSAYAAFDEIREWSLPAMMTVTGGSRTGWKADPRYTELRRRIGLPTADE